MNTGTIQVSVNGQLVETPVLMVQDRPVLLRGKSFSAASIHDEEWLTGDVIQDVPKFILDLQAHRPKIDLFSFAYTQPDIGVKHDYHVEWDNVAAIPIHSFDDWWNNLSQDSRRNVRLAKKRGIRIEEVKFDDAFCQGIKNIYDESPLRQGRRFWHYKKELEDVRRENATFLDRSVFIGAYLDDVLIGFIKLVFVEKTARMMQILSLNAHFDKKPANALIAKAVEICSERGAAYLTYCRYTYGKKKPDTIAEFKRRSGFQEMRFPRYYVPLTWKGRLAIRLGLHLGVKNLLPEQVLEALLKLRARVYARTLGSRPNHNQRCEDSATAAA